jgi:type IV pilus assembly protein PilA
MAPRKLFILIFTSLLFLLSASAQTVPQTARQTLLEMFFSKTPGTFEKHLPRATREALQKSQTTPGVSMLSGFSILTSQLTARGIQLQSFEAGPTLMSIEDPQAHSKFEIMVERDDLRGDEDEIELSFHGYKDGETQNAGAKVRLTLTMKQEAGSWQLSDVMVAVGVSLTDPALLKALATGFKGANAGSGQMSANPPSTLTVTSSLGTANETSALGGIRSLNTAEASYAAAYPERGFTCTLSDLGGMGAGGGPNEHQAMLVDPRLAAGRKNGYVFALSGCDGTPASRYSVSAAPADPSSGTRAFCSDESGVIRFSPDSKAGSCLSAGTPVR